jgi:hypothetical protein
VQTNAAPAAVEQLKNAGVPESIITSTLQQMKQHVECLKRDLVRWQQLKGDVEAVVQDPPTLDLTHEKCA